MWHTREERFEEADSPKIEIKLVASEQCHDDGCLLSRFNVYLVTKHGVKKVAKGSPIIIGPLLHCEHAHSWPKNSLLHLRSSCHRQRVWLKTSSKVSETSSVAFQRVCKIPRELCNVQTVWTRLSFQFVKHLAMRLIQSIRLHPQSKATRTFPFTVSPL